MLKKTDLLFSLVRSALWGGDVKLSEMPSKAFQVLMSLAEQQTVVGLVTETLMRNNVKLQQHDAVRTYSSNRGIAAQNNRVSHALLDLCWLLGSNQIDFSVVKGQTISARYRVADMRTPGDVDFYCDENHFQKAKELIEKEWQVEFDDSEEEEEQHISFWHQKTLFEMHFRLMKFASRSNQRSFESFLQDGTGNYVTIDGVNVPTLQPEMNVVYTFLHLFHHLVEMGCSIRQFCDVAVLLDTQEINADKLEKMLNRLGFMRAFKAVGVILVDNLGLSQEKFPFAITPRDRKSSISILDIVFKHGNFGKYGRENAMRSGLRYYIESLRIKLSHYLKLYRLAPKESRAVLLGDIPKKIVKAVKRR